MANPTSSYTRPAIALHWLIFLMIACAFSLGLYMSDLPNSPEKFEYFIYHKWGGLTIFTLVIIRILWRATHPAPALPASIPTWQRIAAIATHALLYVLMIAIPLTGWLYSSAAGAPPIYYLNLIHLPNLLDKDKELADLFKFMHQNLNFTMLGIVVIHAVAAIKHHFVDHDDVLKRMLPFLK